MRIVAWSDTHGDHRLMDVPDGDVFIHAGDFCRYGRMDEVFDFSEWVKELPHKYKIVIGGNHDWRYRESYMKRFYAPNVYYLEKTGVVIDGVKFWGSPETPIISYDKPWVYHRVDGEKVWSSIPTDVDVLITHGPAHGIRDMNMDGDKCGCEGLLMAIASIKPKYHIFGHIHEAHGTSKRFGTKFYNVAALDASFTMKNKPTVIDFESE